MAHRTKPPYGGSNVVQINNPSNVFQYSASTVVQPAAPISPTTAVAWLPATTTYANDAAALAGGVAVGQIYRNGSNMMVRVT